jgi:hypothetical protein
MLCIFIFQVYLKEEEEEEEEHLHIVINFYQKKNNVSIWN